MLQVLVVVAACVALWRVWASDGSAIAESLREIDATRLGLSLVLAGVGLWCGWRTWLAIVRSLESTVMPSQARQLFFGSQLGKYVPGSVWPVVMQANAAREQGWRRANVAAAYALTLVVSVLTGALVAGLALGLEDRATLERYWWVLLVIPPALVLLRPSALAFAFSLALRIGGREPMAVRPNQSAVLRASAWSLVTWVAFSLHIAVLASAFGTAGTPLVLRSIGAMALAFVTGLLVVFAPAGAGVREAVLTLTLGPLITPSAALAVALVSRLIFVICDLALAGLTFKRKR